MMIDRYRTEPGEWVMGASVYWGPRRWVITLELGRWVVTADGRRRP